MRPRDRLVLAAIAAVLVIAAMWVIVVSPERGKVTSLSAQILAEQSALTQAQGQLDTDRDAVSAYVGHIHQIDEVVRAVPPGAAESALIDTIVKLAGSKVDFQALDVGAASPGVSGPNSLGLTFSFNSNYGNLQSFLAAIDALTGTDGTNVSANGRLFTISSVTLTPSTASQTKASIIATVYEQNAASVPAAGATGAIGATSATGVATP